MCREEILKTNGICCLPSGTRRHLKGTLVATALELISSSTAYRNEAVTSWTQVLSDKVMYSSQCSCGVIYKIHCDFNHGKSELEALSRSKVHLNFQSI